MASKAGPVALDAGPPKGWALSKEVWAVYRKSGPKTKASQKVLKQLRELATVHPSAMAELFLARLALLEAVEEGAKVWSCGAHRLG